ncbi:COG4315 family predicted lipoprotein [Paraburkholderia sp. MM5482-R1]|uniref:COG4315 family predicted lipoprotein n=1 Tax=unclassified Paraburkholderia TaxID=2615204 RepID=UPI003D1C9530
MRKTIALLAPLALAVLHAGAFADPPKLSDGRFVTADGMTLYTFDKDTTPGVSACTGGCMSNWPAATAAPTDKPSGDWTLIPSADGKQQWTYKDHPLYHYAADKQVGDAKGDGFKEIWHIARP